jgi:hypothetical protein
VIQYSPPSMSDSFPQAKDDGCACFPLENTRRQVKRAQKKTYQKWKTVQYIIISYFPAKKESQNITDAEDKLSQIRTELNFGLSIRPNFKNYHFMEGV